MRKIDKRICIATQYENWIEKMIIVLGLNHPPIKHERKLYLEQLWLRQKTNDSSFPDRFITAHEMAISQIAKHS